MRVPVPTLTNEIAPPPLFLIIPENVEVTEPASVPLPTARVTAVPEVLSTMPEPASPLMVSLKPLRSKVPPLAIVNPPGFPTPSGMTLAAPSFRVPAPIFVPPVQALVSEERTRVPAPNLFSASP